MHYASRFCMSLRNVSFLRILIPVENKKENRPQIGWPPRVLISMRVLPFYIFRYRKDRKFMINTFVQIIKIQKLKQTAQTLTDAFLQSFLSSCDAFCRNCRSNDISYFVRYTRKITDLQNGKLVDYDLQTWLFKCGSCDCTHAFLVPLVIPYGRHSLTVVIRALYEYFDTGSVKNVCEKYQITPPTLYRWKKIFFRHKEEWLKGLRNAETTAKTFLKNIIEEYEYCSFSKEFMQGRTDRKAFLQNHRNADTHRFV